MSKLSHNGRARPRSRRAPARSRATVSVEQLIEFGARKLARAGVCFGHGTDNARDESAALVLHALRPTGSLGRAREASRRSGRRGTGGARGARGAGGGLPRAAALTDPGRIDPRTAGRALYLIERRIIERVPTPYLTGRTWFAGLEMCVDRRVLVPRSPIAELIERRFAPWIEPMAVRRVLDLATGSGCIAIACAKAFPRARVDASDISADALAVAGINVRRHRLSRRVRLLKSDHFRALGRRRYDIIVSNPPYVGARELAGLPREYAHEPRLALAGGQDGLDSVRIILREAGRYLRPRGVLVVEVGNTERAVCRAFPRLPLVWLQFERGGGGVFVLTAEQLRAR
ncbi:MAG: 50S ribosomal protein L3 N(5)-glutamine methyltransferase [Steroidobacteraceae bacterium]